MFLNSAFSSTLAREKAFDTSVWRRRALDPQARTFVAVLNQDEDQDNTNHDDDDDENLTQTQDTRQRVQVIISSLILRGPYASSPPPATTIHEHQGTQPSTPSQTPRHNSSSRTRIEWEINGVYTDRLFRGRGVASAVLKAATKFALGESAAFGACNSGGDGGGSSIGVDCVLRLGVTRGNGAARRFYEKAGFVAVLEGDGGDGEVDLVRVYAL
jgi:ribosomal protein S18 acetylase RimI-like enzyme